MQATCPPFCLWPGLAADIDNLIRKCAVCRMHAYKQHSEPFLVRPVPEHAWYQVGMDIFDYGGKVYLCAYDALSNFPEVELLRDTCAATDTEKHSTMLARYGMLVEVCTDNGPQFASRKLSLYSTDIISHVPPLALGFLV